MHRFIFRKSIGLSLVLAMGISVLTGCESSPSSSAPVSSDHPVTSTTLPDDKTPKPDAVRPGNDWTLVKQAAIPNVDNIEYGIYLAFDDAYLLSRSTRKSLSYYMYRPGKDKKPQFIAEHPSLSYSSGSLVLLNQNELWFSQENTDEEENLLTTYKLDIRKKDITKVKTQTCFPPFRYYSKIDENRFLAFGPEKMEEAPDDPNAYRYHLSMWDAKSMTETPLLITSACHEDGTGMISVYYAEGQIYTLQWDATPEQEHSQYYVRIYDLDGTLAKELPLPDLSEFQKQHNALSDIYVRGDMILLSTLSSLGTLAYQMMPDDTLQPLDLSSLEGGSWLVMECETTAYSPDKALYLYNYDINYHTSEVTRRTVLAYNADDHTFIRHELVGDDKDEYYLTSCIDDRDRFVFFSSAASADTDKKPLYVYQVETDALG